MTAQKGELRQGYTTGSCATAAARAALHLLLDGEMPERVTITLPDGGSAEFSPEAGRRDAAGASCCVRKDAGDDPDVTNGLPVCCRVELLDDAPEGHIEFCRGEGVGMVTLPGLGIDVGGPAINPVPRSMIREALGGLLDRYGLRCGVQVTVSVPGGEEVARKTLNARVGVKGGISIIGISGRVIPYSEEAYLESIARTIRVARHNGSTHLVACAGARSEKLLRRMYPDLPETAFIHYGNRVGSTLDMIRHDGGFRHLTVGVMLAKATKLAQGELDLSSRTVGLNPQFIEHLVRKTGYAEDVALKAKALELVRSLVDIVPFSSSEPLYRALADSCRRVCRNRFPSGGLEFVLMTMQDVSMLCDEHGCRDMQ